jgi:tetratricopeptide (TPR) repeat protein
MRIGNAWNLTAILSAQLICAGYFCVSASAGEAGAAGATFLKFTPSPRATAMGESYSSITQDAYAAYWNPAGLASVEQPEFAATYNASFADVTHQYISLAYPLRYGSTLDINVTRLSVAPFQGYDAEGSKTTDISASDQAIGLAYGRTLVKDEVARPVLNVGLNLKSISETLDSASANTFAADLGVVYYKRPAKYWMSAVPAQEMRIAFAVRNIGPGLKFDSGTAPLPLSTTLGFSWLSHPYGNSSLIISMDNTLANDDKYVMNLGAEYTAFQLLALRGGYRSGQTMGSGVRFGVGFKLSFIDLDYSMSPFGDLGSMHKVGLAIKFGPTMAHAPLAGASQRVSKAKILAKKETIENLQMFANDFIELAKKDLEQRKYVSAELNLNKAFNLQPELRTAEWGNRIARLAALNTDLRLKNTKGLEEILAKDNDQANLAYQSMIAYINGADLKALLLAHVAWGTNMRGAPVFEELLNLLATLTHNRVRRDHLLPQTALVKEKLRKAAVSFYVQQFEVAVQECEETVLLDEKNPVAWTRLGSAYFMMGDKEKAKRAYGKALELAPGDSVVRQFMEAQGW